METPLHFATKGTNLECLREFLDAGADVNFQDVSDFQSSKSKESLKEDISSLTTHIWNFKGVSHHFNILLFVEILMKLWFLIQRVLLIKRFDDFLSKKQIPACDSVSWLQWFNENSWKIVYFLHFSSWFWGARSFSSSWTWIKHIPNISHVSHHSQLLSLCLPDGHKLKHSPAPHWYFFFEIFSFPALSLFNTLASSLFFLFSTFRLSFPLAFSLV